MPKRITCLYQRYRAVVTGPTEITIMTREQWNSEFRNIAVDYGYSEMDPRDECWDVYFEDGFTPEEAIMADLEAGIS